MLRIRDTRSYLYEFITAYLALSAEELYRAEDMLSACYYAYAMNCGNQFVSSWFEFNLNINNILAALAARKYKMDVSQVVVGKTDVSEMIRTSNAQISVCPRCWNILSRYSVSARLKN